MSDRKAYQDAYHKAMTELARKKRMGIAERIEAIGKRNDEREAQLLEAPHLRVYNTRRRIRVRRVG